ncbi:MAG: NAD(P)-binding protein [Proteobacteria bacterium]|nr:NAD(P)-binding protein [Pseudomonadota bacterium]
MTESTARAHRIIIIGTGGGGLCMAMQLKRAGFDDFLMLDKAAGLGGTWWHNSYPGAECDVQSPVFLLLRTEERLVAALRRPTRDPGLLRAVRRQVRSRPAHALQYRGQGAALGRCPAVMACRNRQR